MTPSARFAAAIEVIDQVQSTRAPADEVLKAWGRAHRFAGSGDRRAIAEIVFATFRARGRSVWRMGSDGGRGLVLGQLRWGDGLGIDDVAAIFTGEGHAPAPLSVDERDRLSSPATDEPDWVTSGMPEWLADRFRSRFRADWMEEAKAAILPRAPVDLRVNTLRGDLDGALRLLGHEEVRPDRTLYSALGLRLPPAFARDVQKLRAFTSGWVEVQDEGSQIVAALSGAKTEDLVIDYCAGGGGKTLALGAMLQGRGRLVASDVNPKRLAAMAERLERAGVAAEVRTLGPDGEGMTDLAGQANLVFVDAPCSGSGTFRRHPEAAWRLTPETIERLSGLQSAILANAARLVKPGGRLVYVTCSMLEAENDDVAARFAVRNPEFRPLPVADAADTPRLTDEGRAHLVALAEGGHSLQLTPRRTGTDGFFAAFFEKVP